jgi:UDP-N-acetylglucosamine 2-epimerase (non-hydrolysing)
LMAYLRIKNLKQGHIMKTTTGCLVAGTRPECIKLYSLWRALGLKAIWTNQSPDLKQKLIDFDYNCTTETIGGVLDRERPQYLIVQGDTRTAFRGAVSAFERQIPVVHLEAGLRSWDLSKPFPEEGYRRMISEIASIHLCPTVGAANNLSGKQNVFVVGQTSLDYLKTLVKPATQENFALVTIHRREADINRVIEELKKVQEMIPLKIFAHPNQKGQELRKHFKCLDPLPYEQFVQELAKCRLIISDSGGIQEEAPFLNKPLIIAREVTERPEILDTGGAILAGYNLAEAVSFVIHNEIQHSYNPFGLGVAAKLIKEILNAYFEPSNRES